MQKLLTNCSNNTDVLSTPKEKNFISTLFDWAICVQWTREKNTQANIKNVEWLKFFFSKKKVLSRGLFLYLGIHRNKNCFSRWMKFGLIIEQQKIDCCHVHRSSNTYSTLVFIAPCGHWHVWWIYFKETLLSSGLRYCTAPSVWHLWRFTGLNS